MTPDSLGHDLYDHLFFWLREVPSSRGMRWVMTQEWENECRRLAVDLGYRPSFTIDGPEILLGIPIEVRADGGVPHLEQVAP